MRGWYKAKDSYKDLPKEKSYKAVAERVHNALLKGDKVFLETNPRLMDGVDFNEHLEPCSKPDYPYSTAEQVVAYNEKKEKVKAEPEPEPEPEKSIDPSDNWTKDELKSYMDGNEIEYNSGDTKQDLLDKINNEGGIE